MHQLLMGRAGGTNSLGFRLPGKEFISPSLRPLSPCRLSAVSLARGPGPLGPFLGLVHALICLAVLSVLALSSQEPAVSSSLGICLGNCTLCGSNVSQCSSLFSAASNDAPVPLSALSQARQTPSLGQPLNKPKRWTQSPLFGVHAEEGAGLRDSSSQLPCAVPRGVTAVDTNITDFPTPSCGVPSR